jgi:hypothetical protein
MGSFERRLLDVLVDNFFLEAEEVFLPDVCRVCTDKVDSIVQ